MSISQCFTGFDSRRRRRVSLRALFRIKRYKKHRNRPSEPQELVEYPDKGPVNVEHLLKEVNMSSNNGGEAPNVQQARQLMAAVDQSNLMDDPNSFERQVEILIALQNLAFHDADTGGIIDMADWCLRSWLRVLAHHPQDFRVLTGENPRSIPGFS